MPNIKISDLPDVVLPLDAANVFLEVQAFAAGVPISRKIAAQDLSSAFGLDATFVTQSANAILPNERIITAGARISIVDSGPGLAITITGDDPNPFNTPLVILADINTATPPTNENVTDLLQFFDLQNVNELGYLGYTANEHLQMFNLMQGGRIEIITADADGNAGDMDIETGRSLVDGSGGDLFIDVGNGLLTGAGGDCTIDAGNAGLTSNAQGGDVHLRGGSGGGTGAGGPIQLDAGPSGVGATGDGGLIRLLAGNALSTNGDGGDIDITGGALAGSGRKGIVDIDALVQIAPAVPFEPTLVMVDANGAVNNTRFQTVVDSAGLTWRLQATLDDGTFPGDAIVVTRSFGAISEVSFPGVNTLIPSTGQFQMSDDRLMAWGTSFDLDMKYDSADDFLEFNAATAGVRMAGGVHLQVSATGNEEFADFSHDETNFTVAYTLTTAVIHTGAADYDFITNNANAGWRLDSQSDEVMRILPRDAGAFITNKFIQYHNDDNQWTIQGDIRFLQDAGAGRFDIQGGMTFLPAGSAADHVPIQFPAGAFPTSNLFDGLYFATTVAGREGLGVVVNGLRNNLSFVAPNVLVYEFNTDTNTATTPPANEWKMNNATPASVTEIAFDDLIQTRGDFGDFWGANLTTGDKIFIKQQGDETKYLVLTISGALIDGTGFWRIPVTVDDSGVIFDTTEPCSIQFNQLVATGAGPAEITLVIRADINTATPPTTEAVTCELSLQDLDGTDVLGEFGFTNGNNDLFIRNLMHGGEVFITREDAGGVLRTPFEAAASTIMRSTGNLSLIVNNTEEALLAIANGLVSLNHNAVVMARTAVIGSGGFQVNNTVTGAGFERVLTTSDLGGAPSFPLVLADNDQIQFGTGTDITMDWDGVDFEVESLAASQIFNWRDGLRHRWYDPTDTEYVEIEPVSATVFNFNVSNSSAGMLFNGANFWRFLDGSVQCEDGLVVNGSIVGQITFERAGIERLELIASDTSALLVLIQSSGDIFTIRNGINDMWSIQETGGMTVFEDGAADTDSININHDGTDGNLTLVNALDFNITGASVGYKFDESIYIDEKAAANADFAGFGQFWVRSSAPARPTYTDDTGVDQLIDPSISEIVSVVASRTLVITDKGKTIGFTGSTAAQTMTIPANASVAYQIGTFVAFDNTGSVSISIAITTDTLRFAADNTTGTRTLAAGGYAVAQKVAATEWKIAGSALLT